MWRVLHNARTHECQRHDYKYISSCPGCDEEQPSLSALDLVIANNPECRDPLRAILAEYLGGTQHHWKAVFCDALDELTDMFLVTNDVCRSVDCHASRWSVLTGERYNYNCDVDGWLRVCHICADDLKQDGTDFRTREGDCDETIIGEWRIAVFSSTSTTKGNWWQKYDAVMAELLERVTCHRPENPNCGVDRATRL
jgi:hypothetical protein